MNKLLQSTVMVAALVLAAHLSAQAQFTLSAEIRPRAEFRNGFKKPLAEGQDPAFFVEQRTRLNTAFTSEKFDVFISLQDVRNWGSTPSVYKSDPTLQNIYQAWASYKFNAKHAVVVGRMELDYDNVRILGNLDWAAQGRSHDLLKYEYKGEGVKFHAGLAFNQDYSTPEPNKLNNTFYNVAGNYKAMQYAWLHKDWEKSGLSVLFLNNGVQNAADSAVHFSQTFGFYGTKKLGSAALEYDAYYQFGSNPTGKDLSAYMIVINATFFKSKPHNLTLGFEMLSGDDSGTTAKDETFNPMYGTHHKFYGWMDYFYVGNAHKNVGLVNPYIKGKFKTGEKSSVLAFVHEFLSQSAIVTESQQELSKTLGTEIDLVYILNIAPGIVFNLGYSQMFYTDSMEYVKGVSNGKPASWAWAQISFKPTLFTTKTETK